MIGEMIVKMIDYLRDRLKTVIKVSYAILALLILVDWLFFDKSHAHTDPEHWFGFWSIFGFIACVLIIILSKWYGHIKLFKGFTIMTREDYYDK